jgi:hypothetical protein
MTNDLRGCSLYAFYAYGGSFVSRRKFREIDLSFQTFGANVLARHSPCRITVCEQNTESAMLTSSVSILPHNLHALIQHKKTVGITTCKYLLYKRILKGRRFLALPFDSLSQGSARGKNFL